jgi:hypothetical protein
MVCTALRTAKAEITQIVVIHVPKNTPVAGALSLLPEIGGGS